MEDCQPLPPKEYSNNNLYKYMEIRDEEILTW